MTPHFPLVARFFPYSPSSSVLLISSVRVTIPNRLRHRPARPNKATVVLYRHTKRRQFLTALSMFFCIDLTQSPLLLQLFFSNMGVDVIVPSKRSVILSIGCEMYTLGKSEFD